MPAEISQLVVVPVAELDLAALCALAGEASLAVFVLHLFASRQQGERFRHYWKVWGEHLPSRRFFPVSRHAR